MVWAQLKHVDAFAGSGDDMGWAGGQRERTNLVKLLGRILSAEQSRVVFAEGVCRVQDGWLFTDKGHAGSVVYFWRSRGSHIQTHIPAQRACKSRAVCSRHHHIQTT